MKSEKLLNENGRVFGKGIPKAGKRKSGGGPKFKFGEPSATVSTRVPASKKKEVEEIMDNLIQKWCI